MIHRKNLISSSMFDLNGIWRQTMAKKLVRFFGKVLMVFGIFFLLVGGAFGLLDILVNDNDGYVMSNVHEVRSDTCSYFLVFLPDRSGGIDLEHKLVVEPIGGKDLLIGWIWFSDIDKVTTNRSYETPPSWQRDYRVISQRIDISDGVAYNEGLLGPTLFGNESFWMWTKTVGSDEGRSIEVDLNWEPDNIRQTIVFMNADSSEGVSVDISYGTRMPLLVKLPVPLLTVGLILIVLGSLVLVLFKKKD